MCVSMGVWGDVMRVVRVMVGVCGVLWRGQGRIKYRLLFVCKLCISSGSKACTIHMVMVS